MYYIFFTLDGIQGVEFMSNTCRWGSLPARFQNNVLKPCWVCALPQIVMSPLSVYMYENETSVCMCCDNVTNETKVEKRAKVD